MKITKCSLDLTHCDLYDTYKVINVCARLLEKNALWSKYVTSVRPPLRCPIAAGRYRIVNGTSDYTLAARLPIDGNRWITDMRLFETVTDVQTQRQRQEQVWCLDNDVRITLSKGTGKKRKRT